MGAGLGETDDWKVEVSSDSGLKAETADIIVVPCGDCGRAGCEIVKRAVAEVAAELPEVAVAAASDCPKGPKQYVLAVDASSACKASEALRECGARPSAIVSAAEVLSRKGLVRSGTDVRARIEELAAALARAIKDGLSEVLEEVRERDRYRHDMAPVLKRFRGIWSKVESLPSPNGVPGEKDRSVLELLAKRARNLFVRFDELVPPSRWMEPHDLFQDALLCIAYACEGYAAGDSNRWEQNLEKARVQIEPLLRRLGD